MASLARRGAAPLRGRDGRAGILAAFGRRGVPRGWPRLARGPGRAGAGAQLRGRHAPVPRGRASLPPQVPPAAHRGAQDQRGCLGRQGGDRVGAHRPRHGEGPGAGGRRGLARRVAHGHGARAGHAGDGGAGGGRNPVRRQGAVRDGQPRRAHRPRRDRAVRDLDRRARHPHRAASPDDDHRAPGQVPSYPVLGGEPDHPHHRQAAGDRLASGDRHAGRRVVRAPFPHGQDRPARDGVRLPAPERDHQGQRGGGDRRADLLPDHRPGPRDLRDREPAGRDREADPDHAAQRDRGDGAGPRALLPRHHQRQAARDPGRGDAQVGREGEPRRAQGHQPAARHPRRDGEADASRARSPRGDPHGGGREAVAHPAGRGHPAVGDQQGRRREAGEDPLRRGGGGRAAQGGRRRGPGHRADHDRHQGNRGRSRAILDRDPLYRGAQGHGHEPAEQQGDLPALRGDGRAVVAGRHPGDAGGAIGKRRETRMNWKTIAALALAAVSLSAYPANRLPVCDSDNGGLTLPAGFCALVVADQVGAPRHIAVAPNGDLFVALESRGASGGVLALRDTSGDEKAYATGIRNAVGLAFAPDGQLWATQHGRDQLGQNWPKLFTVEQNAEKPSEELVRVRERDDFGWPYCYHDLELGHLVLAPEYGGDGKQVGRCAQKQEPAVAFPGHWAPDGLTFYTGAPLPTQFPARYMGGAFIAFHGSWNRAPLPQAGYRVVFVPFRDGRPVGTYETFADGVWHENGAGPQHRPVGVAVGPDGPLYSTGAPAGWGATPM